MIRFDDQLDDDEDADQPGNMGALDGVEPTDAVDKPSGSAHDLAISMIPGLQGVQLVTDPEQLHGFIIDLKSRLFTQHTAKKSAECEVQKLDFAFRIMKLGCEQIMDSFQKQLAAATAAALQSVHAPAELPQTASDSKR